MNNNGLTKAKLEVNSGINEQHVNNNDLTKAKLGVNPGIHEQQGHNQKTTGGEPMCS